MKIPLSVTVRLASLSMLIAVGGIAPYGLALASEDQTSVSAAQEASILTSQVREAGRLCKEGDLDGAVELLWQLHTSATLRHGIGHAVTRYFEMNLDKVAAARGGDGKHPGVSKATALPDARDQPRQRQEEISPELDRALKSLRPCMSPAGSKPLKRARPRPELPLSGEGGFAVNLEAARSLANKGQYQAAVVAARRARDLVDESQSSEARLQAYLGLALLRLQVGDGEGAYEAARDADGVASELAALDARISIARVYAQTRHLEEAQVLLTEIAPAAVRSVAAAPELAEAQADLALRLGAPDRALRSLALALELHERRYGARNPSTAAVLQLRGDASRMMGDLPGAKRDYNLALEIRREVLGPDHPDTARSMNALGVLLADFADWREADRSFGRALAILEHELPPHHPEVVTVRANRALVAWAAREDEAAANDYAATLSDLAQAYGEDHPVLSAGRRNLARMEEDLGNSKKAEALLVQALSSHSKALGNEHPALAPTRLALGGFYARSGRLVRAEESLTSAVVLLKRHYGDEHPLVARARTEISRVASSKGDGARAWQESREAARILDLYLARSLGAMPDRQRVLIASTADEVVGALLSSPDVAPKDLYVALIPQRDSVLRSIASTRAAARDRGEVGRAAFGMLETLRTRYVAAVLSDTRQSAERAAALAREIDAQETVVALSEGVPARFSASQIIDRACARLPLDSALVEFFSFDRSSSRRVGKPTSFYSALVMRPSLAQFSDDAWPRVLPASERKSCSVHRVDLGPANVIEEAADRLGRAMRDQRNDAPAERAALTELILNPLKQELAGSSRWLLVPDGALWGVPFAALPDPHDSERYLVERVTLGTLTSIFELAEPSDAELEPSSLAGALLFGAPEFGNARADGGPIILTAKGPCRLLPFEPLPGTARELREISGLLPEPHTVLGEHATKSRLREELATRPSIIHLATHGYFAGAGGCDTERDSSREEKSRLAGANGPLAPNPLLLSGIVFAGANASQRLGAEASAQTTSGILTAYEVAGLDLAQTRLVVLSACDTGTGLHRRGQEIQGLRWGFRAAGAQSLVTSLWRSNDAVTRKLMHSFYTHLIEAEAAPDLFRGAEALRQAQLARIKGEKRLGIKKPLNWSNFVFSGVY